MIKCFIYTILALFLILVSCEKKDVTKNCKKKSKTTKDLKVIDFIRKTEELDFGTRATSNNVERVSVLALNSTFDEPLFLHESVSNFPKQNNTQDTITTRSKSNNEIYSIKVWGYKREPNQEFSASSGIFINGLEYVNSENVYKTNVYWPESNQKVRFYAIANHSKYNIVEGKSEEITIDSNSSNQQDLLFASTLDVPHDEASLKRTPYTPLLFKHVLTGIRLKSTDIKDTWTDDERNHKLLKEGKITKIVFKNIYTTAKYDFVLSSWTDYSNKVSKLEFDYTNNEILINNNSKGEILNPINNLDDTFLFYVLPQTFGSDAEMEITYNIKNHDFVLSASLYQRKNWELGEIVTYSVSNKSIQEKNEFQVKIDGQVLGDSENVVAEVLNDGTGSSPIRLNIDVFSNKVTSNLQNTANRLLEPLAWGIEYSEDKQTWTNNAPSWLNISLNQNTFNEGIYKKEVALSVLKQTQEESIEEYMKNLDEKGSEDKPYDLSLQYNGKRNTANCYIINAPGWYKFPLVYGNAIKDGQDNVDAYKKAGPRGVTDNWWAHAWKENFVRHDGKGIQDPWLKNNGIQVDNAVELWTDTPVTLIHNLQIEEDCIKFYVPKTYLQQGNSVIVARDNNKNIVWSWHLWFTYVSPYETKTKDVVESGLLRFPLGWYDDEGKYYRKRDVYVKFTQNSTNETRIAHIKQKAIYKSSGEGRAVYYQGGRKDPFPSVKQGGGTSSNTSGISLYLTESSWQKRYDYTIQHPNIFLTGGGHHYLTEEYQYNVWNNHSAWSHYTSAAWAQYEATSGHYVMNSSHHNTSGFFYFPVKTVYDPSPSGFVLPPPSYFADEKNRQELFGYNAGVGYINQDTGKYEGFVPKGGDGEGTVWTNFVVRFRSDWELCVLYMNTKDKPAKVEVRSKYLTWGFPVFSIKDENNGKYKP